MSGTTPTEITAETLASWIDGEVVGDGSRIVRDGSSVDHAAADHFVFVTTTKSLAAFANSPATVALASRELPGVPEYEGHKTLVLVDDSRAAFLFALARLRGVRPRAEIGVSPAAFVSESALIGAGTNVHPTAHVCDDVVIGENCEILPGAYIGPGCRLGNDVVVHPYAVLYGLVQTGDRVTIHATAVIGADGFGYYLKDGRHVKLPHLGHVRIGDDVEIGASATVDRGMIGATVVGDGTKLDNLVQVAHNVKLGKHNIMVAQVGLAGSVTSGDYVVCAGHVGVADHMHLGTGCTVGAKAGVKDNIPAGETWVGQPAQPAQTTIKGLMSLKKLPELRRQVNQMGKRLDALEARPTTERDAA